MLCVALLALCCEDAVRTHTYVIIKPTALHSSSASVYDMCETLPPSHALNVRHTDGNTSGYAITTVRWGRRRDSSVSTVTTLRAAGSRHSHWIPDMPSSIFTPALLSLSAPAREPRYELTVLRWRLNSDAQNFSSDRKNYAVEISALLRHYAASSGNPLTTFRDNVSVPSHWRYDLHVVLRRR
jgi:hypothetical protein